jgi:hypothetical protein
VDTIKMDDGTTIDVTITDVVNPCVFFKAADFGLGLTGLELPNPDWSLKGPPGATSTMSWVSGSVSRSVWRTAKRAASEDQAPAGEPRCEPTAARPAPAGGASGR